MNLWKRTVTDMKNSWKHRAGRALFAGLSLAVGVSLILTTITREWWLEGYFATGVIVAYLGGFLLNG